MVVYKPLVRALLETLAGFGLAEERLFAEAQLVAARSPNGEETLDHGEFTRLQEVAIRLTGDETLGLRLAEQATPFAYEAVGHMLVHASCLREAIALASRFGCTILEAYHLTLHERGDTATLRFEFAQSLPLADRMMADFMMAGLQRLVASFVGSDATITRVRFAYERPHDVTKYLKVFRGPVEFAQQVTELEFPRHYLQVESPYANGELLAALRDQAERVVARRVAGPIHAAAVQRYLRACVPMRIPTMNTAARELGLSPRSLRRRLAQDGCSYRALLRTAVEESAIHMLVGAKRSVQDTALAVGFSDASSFERAFKRWTGLTPNRFRERALSRGEV